MIYTVKMACQGYVVLEVNAEDKTEADEKACDMLYSMTIGELSGCDISTEEIVESDTE